MCSQSIGKYIYNTVGNSGKEPNILEIDISLDDFVHGRGDFIKYCGQTRYLSRIL